MTGFESDYQRMEEEFLSIRAEIGYLKSILEDRRERLVTADLFRSRRVSYTRQSSPPLLLGKDQSVETSSQLARLISLDRFVFVRHQP